MDIQQLSFVELRHIAKTFNLPRSSTKQQMVKVIEEHYHKLQKFICYNYIRQLGHQGKDGRTFLATDSQQREVAVKIFKPSKSTKQIEKEATLQQQVADAGIAPKVYDYSGAGKYIVMEKLDDNLYDLFCKQKGQLTVKQQKHLIQLFKALDKTGVFHGDPNPLNFMYKNKKLYIIDFGFAKPITTDLRRKYGDTPNLKMMTQGIVLKLRQVYTECTLKHLSKWCFIKQ